MTRLLTDGAEMQDVLLWASASGLSVVTANPYASPYFYKIDNYQGSINLPTALSECYFRERVKLGGIANMSLPSIRSSTTRLAVLATNASGKLQYLDSNTTPIVVSDFVMAINTWYLIELYFKLDNNPNGRFVVYVDGTKIIDFTGDTLIAAPTTFDNFYFADGTLYLDDFALNDTDNANGLNDNSWCGDGIVVKLTPNEDGAHNNWHGSDLDDTDNFLLVDDFPKDDDTTYVYHDASGTGVQDQYSLTNTDFTDKTILRIYPEARAKKTTADAATLKLGILASGGTDDMSAGKALTTTYARVVGDDEKVNPVDSGAWEDADLDALELVIEVG